MNKIRLSVVLFLSMLASSSAFAGMRLSVVAAGNYGLTNTTAATITIKGGIGYGGGLLLGFPMGSSAFFELGGIYNQYTLTTTDSSGTIPDITATSSAIHIPATFNFMLGRAVSLGLGGWYSLGMGSSSGATDYGAQGGLRFHFSPRVFLDTSYTMGLNSSASVKPTGILALLGLSFGGAK